MADEFTLSDGTTLRVLRSSAPLSTDDARIAVLFVHGYAMDHRIWHRFTDTIADAVQVPIEVLAYDHRGHGDSQLGGAANANIGRLADDLAELITHTVRAERVVLVGHAMGGLVVTEFAKRRPAMFARRVAGLVFLATPTDLPSETAQALPMAAGRLVRELEHVFGQRVVRRVGAHIDPAKTAAMRWWFFGEQPQSEDLRLTAEMFAGNWPDTVALFNPAFTDYHPSTALAITGETPALAVVGARDKLCHESDARSLVEHLPAGHALVLPTHGHMLPLEAFAELLPRVVSVVHKAARTIADRD